MRNKVTKNPKTSLDSIWLMRFFATLRMTFLFYLTTTFIIGLFYFLYEFTPFVNKYTFFNLTDYDIIKYNNNLGWLLCVID